MTAPLTPEAFAEAADVSRETLAVLRLYAAHLVKWQAALNLVSRNTLEDLWRRHMLDSVQLAPYLPDTGAIADLGSGAGFPGLPLALVTGREVELIESDVRKCAFLREAVRLTRAPASVTNARIESRADSPENKSVDIVVARALAPLSTLCTLSVSLGAETCVFLKGVRWQEELTEAEKDWKMDVETFDSQSAPESRILRLRRVAPRIPS